jgi:hypothetical protein
MLLSELLQPYQGPLEAMQWRREQKHAKGFGFSQQLTLPLDHPHNILNNSSLPLRHALIPLRPII